MLPIAQNKCPPLASAATHRIIPTVAGAGSFR